jgi:hypothetical protein
MQLDGYFNQRDEPVVTLNIGSLSIEVLVDTGFGGSLIIPGRIANRLDKKFEGPEEFQSVTGEVFLADLTRPVWTGLGEAFEYQLPRVKKSTYRSLEVNF